MRTGAKASTPEFGGSGDSLTLTSTIQDTSQGAVVGSPNPTNQAIEGVGYFAVTAPANINAGGTVNAGSKIRLTRDGDFTPNAQGQLANSSGLVLVAAGPAADLSGGAAVYDDAAVGIPAGATRLTPFVQNAAGTNLAYVKQPQMLQYDAQYGSTVYDASNAGVYQGSLADDATVHTGSLEASNTSMTGAVPAMNSVKNQVAATTKVMTILNENEDSILNVVK